MQAREAGAAPSRPDYRGRREKIVPMPVQACSGGNRALEMSFRQHNPLKTGSFYSPQLHVEGYSRSRSGAILTLSETQ